MGHGDDARFWRDRAEECRTKSEQMISPDARDALQHMAASYEGMAARADRRHERELP